MTDFSRALMALKAGERIAREGWNGKGMYLCLARGMPVELMVCRPHLDPLGEEAVTLPHLDPLGEEAVTLPRLDPLGEEAVTLPRLDPLGEEGMLTLPVKYPKHIAMRTATKDVVPWLASVTDIMADDWIVLDRGVPL